MAKGLKHGSGGASLLNFKVVGGTSAPSNPKENTIWVNTDTAITSWVFSANEPNVCQATVPTAGDPWILSIPLTLHEGDILSFTIPETVPSTFEAIRMYDGSGKLYYVRTNSGAVTAWPAGTKVSFVISNTSCTVGIWGSDGGSANIYKWGDYYHNEGIVWFPTGASSPVAFNALKKNSIVVYPASAKQYVNGAWVGKRASYYQSGEWKYERAVIVPNTGVSWTVASGTVTANKTSSATTITHTAKTATNGNAGDCAIYTEFDASSYGVLYVKGSYSVNNSSTSSQLYQLELLTASNSLITTIYSYTSKQGTNSGTQTFEKTIDISAVTGKCRIRSLARSYVTSSTTHTATISSCIVY